MRLLDRVGGQHGPPGATGVHDVGVVTEYGQGMGGDGAGRHMDDRRGQLAGDLEHVGHHQQQALRGGEGGGQGAFLQRAVQGAGGAGLGLHLDHVGHLAPKVGLAGRGPVVGELAHGRRRRYRVDGDYFGKGVGDTGCSLVAVDTYPFAHVHAASHARECSMPPLSSHRPGPPDRALCQFLATKARDQHLVAGLRPAPLSARGRLFSEWPPCLGCDQVEDASCDLGAIATAGGDVPPRLGARCPRKRTGTGACPVGELGPSRRAV